MKNILTIAIGLLTIQFAFTQGTIEAEKVIADSLLGDGSRITGISNQNLAVSQSGDTLFITGGNFVIIPGLSDSNSGNVFANAGADIINACETSFNLQASELQPGTNGEWSIISGTGGSLINKTLPQAYFSGIEGESYLLQWTVQHGGGSSSFDQLNISIATNTETSVANAGVDLFAIMTQTITLTGNAPKSESQGRWTILDGTGGIISDITDPQATFAGTAGQSYILRWQHYNDCSTSSDEVTLTFNESASGVTSANGRYFIPDPKFRQYLQIAYPSVMDGDSLIVTNGHLVETIRITNLDVLNLDGIQHMTGFTLFEALNNQDLTAIPYLSDSLEVLRCHASLSILPDFPPGVDTIAGSNWRLSTLPTLPSNLKYLKLDGLRQLTSVPNFPPALEHLELRYMGRIQDIPSIPSSVKIVILEGISGEGYYDPDTHEHINLLFTGTLNIPAMANYFSANYIYGLDNFPLLPGVTHNLQTLQIEQTDISAMPSLYDFTNLDNMNLSYNSLLKLDSLPFALQQIQVDANPIICVENKPPLVVDELSEYPICP